MQDGIKESERDRK